MGGGNAKSFNKPLVGRVSVAHRGAGRVRAPRRGRHAARRGIIIIVNVVVVVASRRPRRCRHVDIGRQVVGAGVYSVPSAARRVGRSCVCRGVCCGRRRAGAFFNREGERCEARRGEQRNAHVT